MGLIKLLFLADTHLGFDYPFKPRIQKQRRGDDFFNNYQRALEPARSMQVDAVVHGGDLFFRSRVPARLVEMALAPLREIADLGVKIFLVPGNHERSQIPYKILSLHPHLHIFDRPKTFTLKSNGFRLGLSGFPYCRDSVRTLFPEILEGTGWKKNQETYDGKILCVHHCFEGATVGPRNYTFRFKEDVVRLGDIPEEFDAVLSGHIHRSQVLKKDLEGRSIPTPVFYPGSIERTSFAEMDEKKGYILMELEAERSAASLKIRWEFIPLPSRPMVRLRIPSHILTGKMLKGFLQESFKKLDPQSVVKLYIDGPIDDDCRPILRAASLRALAPKEMHISIRFQDVAQG